VHSLHAYFIRRGDHDEPIRFEVDRVRNGRSFASRRVVARQSGGAILTMEASFQVHEESVDVQPFSRPDVEPPDTSDDKGWSSIFERRMVRNAGRGRAQGWIKVTDEIGDDPLMHACALAYVSDDLPTDALASMHPKWQGGDDWPFMNASLDHAMWFHRPQRADDWQLHDFTGHALFGNRGTSIGHVFTTDGIHVATVAQEVVIREPREGGTVNAC